MYLGKIPNDLHSTVNFTGWFIKYLDYKYTEIGNSTFADSSYPFPMCSHTR